MRIASGHRTYAPTVVLVLSLICTATARYSGGAGTAEDPYQITTAADLILLGESPEDYDKHFVLTADIDLDPNLPGGKVFDRAVIAPDPMDPNLPAPLFTGVFDGTDHTLSHLTVRGAFYLGLFGRLASGAEVRELGVVDADISGGYYVGAVVGHNHGAVVGCHATGSVRGSAAPYTGGLVGDNDGHVLRCCSAGTVVGTQAVGGLAGSNGGTVAQCYSAGAVTGGAENVGGLVGFKIGSITGCFWDTQSSGWATSAGGTGKTTAEMQDIRTYQNAGWDWVDTTEDGTSQIWQMPPAGGYPVLAVFEGHTPPQLQGAGTLQNPYQISDARDLGAMVRYGPYAHYRLAASIDLSGVRWGTPVLPSFGGTFDGNALTISHLTIDGGDCTGLFGRLVPGAEVRDLGLVDVNVANAGNFVGGLTGQNKGVVTRCFSTGAVSGVWSVGGLVGDNGTGRVTLSRSDATVGADMAAGGLVGKNYQGTLTGCLSNGAVISSRYAGGLVGLNEGTVTACCSNGTVSADDSAGGLAAVNTGTITNSYATGQVTGTDTVGGLVGANVDYGLVPFDIWCCLAGTISNCYASGAVSGGFRFGGLVGDNVCDETGDEGIVTHCFWDTQTSGQAKSPGGTGRTTLEMQTASTFLDAGWDFVDETANGTEELWWILEGEDYPRLWWQLEEAAEE